MSLRLRRESLRKSSIGIDSIRKSITNLSEGLVSIGKNSSDLLKETRKSNQLKSKLIRQDGEFFKRRRENALRRQREDELEASTITGVTKRQGSLVQKSTRGFLGRILDFIGILIIGWALTNLPKIIKAFQKLFGLIKRVVGVFTGFISGMKNFFTGLGTGIDNFLSAFKRFDFREDDKVIKDTFEKTQNNINKLNKDFTESITAFVIDKDIRRAGQVYEDLGLAENAPDQDLKNLDKTEVENNTIDQDSTISSESTQTKTFSLSGNTDENQEDDDESNESNQQIERRNLGGKLEEGQIALVGDAAGTDSRSAEIFVPDQDGTVVSNNDVEDIIAGTITTPDSEEITPRDEGSVEDEVESELDNLLSDLTDQGGSDGGASSSTSLPSVSGTSSGMNLDEEEEKKNQIQTVKKDDASAITPMQKNIKFDFKKLKKPKITIVANNQNNVVPSVSGGTNSNSGQQIVLNKGNSKETLSNIQSIILF
tara:strand:- start:2942 stop:4390 length:1449 start_codon:yes stop_codon:yes gene_type:complete